MRNRSENATPNLVGASSAWTSRLAVMALVALAYTQMGAGACNGGVNNHEAIGQQTFTSPHADPMALDGNLLYVANTTSGQVDIIDTTSAMVVDTITVGLEPVSVAVRPGADEVWVSNHVSDTVSVIDTDPASDTYRTVIQTVQDLDSAGVTQFDEPVGIAFTASGAKAYVALSSRNDIAVIDATTYSVTSRIHITAQEPRALAINGNHLYVPAFESFNQTELALCPDPGNQDPTPGQCTMDGNDLVTFVTTSPNIPGADVAIATDPDAPDRDLFVIDTTTDTVVQSVSGVGTLLYGVTVGSNGSLFITQTDARNDENPDDSDLLIDLDNRMFLNQIAELDCSAGTCTGLSIHELEPLPPSNPAIGDALATPYAIAISDDNSTLLATAMGTSRLFSVDASSGAILDILDLDNGDVAATGQQIPRGVTLVSDGSGAPLTAYVHNTLENTVSVVSVAGQSGLLTHGTKIAVGSDPTPDAIRRGRIAFMNGFAATNGTFSCESCHPDGNTDQLLWRIGGDCVFCGGGRGHEVRSTMPVRGLANTLPLHWDGSLGDPFGGPNGEVGAGGSVAANCTDDASCFRHLVDASLSGVMCEQQQQGQNFSCNNTGPSGLPGEMTSAERDDMATFLANVAYPPARSRPIDDVMTQTAVDGFSDFFIIQPGALGVVQGISTCADMNSGCHDMPLGAGTNSSTLGGFDAPTMRGLTDRTLQFSVGITNPEEVLEFAVDPGTIEIPPIPPFTGPDSEFPWDPAEGYEEITTYGAAFLVFGPIYGSLASTTFQMVEEGSTGHSGAIGRQVTLNASTTTGGNLADTETVMDALELADTRGLVNLRAVGRRDRGDGVFLDTTLSFRSNGTYANRNDTLVFTHADMLNEAAAGASNFTLTAELRANVGNPASPAPLLSVSTTADGGPGTTGASPAIPMTSTNVPFDILGIDVEDGSPVFVDGLLDATATATCLTSVTDGRCDAPATNNPNLRISLTSLPSPFGVHLIQVQNFRGLISNEFPICVGNLNFQCD